MVKCPNCFNVEMVQKINIVSSNGGLQECPTDVWECPECGNVIDEE